MRKFLTVPVILALVLAVGCSNEPTTTPVQDLDVLSTPAVENGVSMVAGGVGLFDQPASFDVTVPVANASDILEAYFYWTGRAFEGTGDASIVINGLERNGALLDSYQVVSGLLWTFFYKLDAMEFVNPGLNSFTIDGWDLGAPGLNAGIGLVVIYADDSSDYLEVQILEPNEFLYHGDPDYPQGIVHNFAFDPVDVAREGSLLIFCGDTKPERPDRIWYHSGPGDSHPGELIGGAFDHIDNELDGGEGEEFDVYLAEGLAIPADAGHFAYQLESPPAGNGDSFMHVFAAFCVPIIPPPPPEEGCWHTIGFWKKQFNVATGDKPGNQHVSDAQLTELLATVAAFTTIPDYTGADDVISFREADNFLDLHGSQTKCARALQQHLANLINFAVNGLNGSIMVDIDYDDVPDMEWGDAITEIEALILTGDEDDCGDAKDMADSINNMLPECEFNDEDKQDRMTQGR